MRFPKHPLFGITLALCWVNALAQQTPVPHDGHPKPPPLTSVSSRVWRLDGRDTESGISYVRLFLLANPEPGKPWSEPFATAEVKASPGLEKPTLTGQCTQDSEGKSHFELFANFGAVPDPAFYAPWRARGANDLFPPSTEKVMLTMEFLGYTRVKPVRRQFERTRAPGPEQLRYTNPGSGSSNLEKRLAGSFNTCVPCPRYASPEVATLPSSLRHRGLNSCIRSRSAVQVAPEGTQKAQHGAEPL